MKNRQSRFGATGAYGLRALVAVSCMLCMSTALAAVRPAPGSWYLLSNRASQRVLGVVGGQVQSLDKRQKGLGNKVLWRFSRVKQGGPGHYRITNAAIGGGESLDSTPSAPTMGKSGLYSGQIWKLDTTRTPGYIYLSNLYQRDKSLGVYPTPGFFTGNGKMVPGLTRTADNAAQQWKLIPYTPPRNRRLTQHAPTHHEPIVVNPAALGRIKPKTTTHVSKPGQPLVINPGVVDVLKPRLFKHTGKPGNVDLGGGKIVLQGGTSIKPQQGSGGGHPLILPKGTGGNLSGLTYTPKVGLPNSKLTFGAKIPDYFGPEWARTTGAARGQKTFKEPGLTPFLLAGALPILDDLYRQPAVIVNTLRLDGDKSLDAIVRKIDSLSADIVAGKSPSGSERRFLQTEFLRVARNPVDNEAIKGLMGAALIGAAHTPPNKRSRAQQAFVSDFAHYMQRRKLFIAERAQYLYRQWREREQNQLKSEVGTLVNIPQVPPDVIRQAHSAAELGSNASAVAAATGLAMAGEYATLSSEAAIVAVAPYQAGGEMGLFAVEGVASSSASSAASALAGPVGIVAAGVVVIGVSIDQVVKAEDYRKQVAQDVANARKPIDLYKLASTEKGLKEIRYYWALATGVKESGAFYGAPAAAFRLPPGASRYNLDRVPFSATGLGMKGVPNQLKGVTLAGNAGAKYGPIEAAWRSYAVAYNNCFSPQNITYFQATGHASCPPQRPTWASVDKGAKYPPNMFDLSAVKLPAKWQKMAQLLKVFSKRQGICRSIGADGASIGTYQDGKCTVSDNGRLSRTDKGFTVLRAQSAQVKWVRRTPPGMLGWVPLSILNVVKAGTPGNRANVGVCRVGKVAGWVENDMCHVVIGNSVTRMPIFDVLVRI